MKLARATLLAVAASLIVACTSGDDETTFTDDNGPAVVERPEWGEIFAESGVSGTFALRELGSVTTYVWDVDRALERRLPASTFKILNSMIILEEGRLTDVDEHVAWDGINRDFDAWNRDHSLRSGIEVSAVWMYQAMAREVGDEAMGRLVAAADYGNRQTGEQVDDFWLRGDIRINTFEQVDFLERMLVGDLPFRRDVVESVREILVRSRGEDWSWSHKTGTALAEEPVLGWLVGTTAFGARSWSFAMNIDLVGADGLDGQLDPEVRQRLAGEILVLEGALPPTAWSEFGA